MLYLVDVKQSVHVFGALARTACRVPDLVWHEPVRPRFTTNELHATGPTETKNQPYHISDMASNMTVRLGSVHFGRILRSFYDR